MGVVRESAKGQIAADQVEKPGELFSGDDVVPVYHVGDAK